MSNLNLATYSYAPKPSGIYLQYMVNPQMESLVYLRDNIMFYLVLILFAVIWMILSIIIYYFNRRSHINNTRISLTTLIKIILAVVPWLILIVTSLPSINIFYLIDEVSDPSLTVSVENHQWYLSEENTDFLNDGQEEYQYISESNTVYYFDPEAPSSIGGGEGSSSGSLNPQGSGNKDSPGSVGEPGSSSGIPDKFKSDLISFVYKVDESCADTSEELVNLARYSKSNVALELYNLSIELVNLMDKKGLNIEIADSKGDMKLYKKESLDRCQGVLLNTAKQYACIMRDQTIHATRKKSLDGVSEILSGINREVLTRRFKD